MLAIIDVRCSMCDRRFMWRKRMRGEFADGKYTCPQCVKARR
jgi:hypothetical protein